MKIVCVICEFNPFHNGHAYILKQARNFGDHIICIMSGNFMQRGFPAVLDSTTRAKIAIENGADAVIELPALYATACAEQFAYAAIKIASQIEGATSLMFGSESADLSLLNKVAEIQSNESGDFSTALKANLKQGQNYPTALSKATGIDINLPNDILGVEYIKAIKKQQSGLQPIAIKRVGGGYHDKHLDDEFSSASAIRGFLHDKEKLLKSVPKNSVDHLLKVDQKSLEQNFSLLIRHAILAKDLSRCPDYSEGLAVRLVKFAKLHSDASEIFGLAHSRCYTFARAARLALQALLGITHYPKSKKIYARLLGVRKEIKNQLLSILSKSIIFRGSNNRNNAYVTKIETHAENAYNIVNGLTNTDIYAKL